MVSYYPKKTLKKEEKRLSTSSLSPLSLEEATYLKMTKIKPKNFILVSTEYYTYTKTNMFLSLQSSNWKLNREMIMTM